ncbi:hypothetical protein ACFUJU_28710 [Streptomyces sp. NPDC057235]|uniref:hypothetical protein n=1 Tax=Streptomyces sp. NPDC057235 TaxID=3346058 RepID=UPI003633542A
MPYTGPPAGSPITDDRWAQISGLWVPYTPTWTATSGTAPSLGNGQLAAEYAMNGGQCSIRLGLIAGSGTTFGSGGAWQFSLPFPAIALAAANLQWIGSAIGTDAGQAYYAGSCRIFSGGTTVMCISPITATGAAGGEWTASRPFTWATGDFFNIGITYQPA